MLLPGMWHLRRVTFGDGTFKNIWEENATWEVFDTLSL